MRAFVFFFATARLLRAVLCFATLFLALADFLVFALAELFDFDEDLAFDLVLFDVEVDVVRSSILAFLAAF